MDERGKRDRWSAAAIAIAALGALIGAPSLFFPYGRDQGLFHYIGREWFLHGAVPYRDTFDLKPPPIYVIYGLCVRVFGDVMWGIRVVEWLLLVPATGMLAASLSMAANEHTPKIRLAMGVLGANVLYFGFFNFWNTAQCEIWCAVACLAAVWVIQRTQLPTYRAAVLSGGLAGFAFLMKPSVGLMVLVVAVAFVWQHRADRKKAALGLVAFGAASLGVILLTVLYFAKVGALSDFVDVVIRYNRAYVKYDRNGDGLEDFVMRFGTDHNRHDPWASAFHIAVLLGAVRGGIDGKDRDARPRWLLAGAFIVTATVGVFLQAKFYPYHYGLLIAGYALGFALIIGDLQRIVPASRAKTAIVAGAPLLVFLMTFNCFRSWAETAYFTACYLSGRETRDWYTDKFRATNIHYYFKDREQVGQWVKEHSSPDDKILVRAFEPTIYVSAQRSYGGRFATTHHLTSEKVLYRRPEWRAEDRAAIERIMPRYVIAQRPRPDMVGWPTPYEIDDATFFTQFGYRQVHAAYEFVVMERSP